jgi:hypothetical protein
MFKKQTVYSPKKQVCHVKNRVTKCAKRPTKKRCSCKKHTCGCNSAFRAIANVVQPVPGAGGNPFPQVLYGLEQFDLNNEYDPSTSTFIPKRSGVYSITASVRFDSNASGAVDVGLAIRANDAPILTDRETFPFGDGSIDAGGLARLRAGDRVQVFFTISGVAGGNIEAGVGTRFEGARIG